ncbi:hypothetical protein VD0002_g969 [Verticillium dahliae]|uniref:SAM and PH domain-containing protein n=3 Tax=Verticillium TaxID=1036719 RepID=G2X2Y1_VERDV|nr:SAM and PH domain-containing protein [Verticillium dahliae VdLs.17]KAF3346429.1 Peroxisomal membrane protein LPX1 [Verticillium dahliae VDG2]KAH6700478.1 SAM and PH domain-containing protein [Verticillium dahliae]EGY22737.1 SAM and PH domain-containing protein [Verticillium dahliae VdLs.17]PNH34756.1 hypothetical protein BJF96_g2052 [Verticillium dahliae]PNH44576.1 hypothetical protein VD0004_g3155 [Verticillium dahliae]
MSLHYTQQHRTMGERRLHHSEMRQKANLRDTFFGLKSEPQDRPISVATEFVDTDWDEEIISEAEDNSPRHSVNSSGGQPSITTLSSYDEVPTPRSSQSRVGYLEGISPQAVEGPRGPHLFRSSTTHSFEEEAILTLSPITPKTALPFSESMHFMMHEPLPTVQSLPPRRRSSPTARFTTAELDSSNLLPWTPEMVAQSMLNAGIEYSVAERFVQNDINGAILITLKFEDLKELDIPSFGMRHNVWHQIQNLRDSRPSSPRAPTPIQDEPSREVKREKRRDEGEGLLRKKSSRRKPKKLSHDDIITPLESVSIVGIEQHIPRPHFCSKGENCSKYRKAQRLIDAFRKEHPFVDLESGAVLVAGDPGNPMTARALDPSEIMRPMSDAVPSVVASSDILGTGGVPPMQYLQEAALRGVQARDPQDNVRQFLDFQQCSANEVPPTPPFEILASTKAPKEGLRALPKLAIPGKSPLRLDSSRATSVPPPSVPQPTQQQSSSSSSQEHAFVPYRMDKAEPLSPDLMTPTNPYRFGTPFSEMDVPVTAVPVDHIERNVSQSVPPDMNYHTISSSNPPPARAMTQSRASARRPSFPVLPALDENTATPVVRTSPVRTSPVRGSPQRASVKAPPRVAYPWSPATEGRTFEQAIPPSVPVREAAAASATSIVETPLTATTLDSGISYQGPMKKRKTRMLRHEWNDGYFTLKGTRLAMHKDAVHLERALEYVDIDDYAIACSSLASQSKLSAAFKRVHLHSGSRDLDSVGAFAFQLIPQDKNGNGVTTKLRKRESGFSFSGATVPAEGVNGTGKTHHFAVRNRDERIDWMRELMLAKALRQKGQGFEVSVNGNMI